MHPELSKFNDVRFHGDPDSLYDRHLVFDYAIDPALASPRERYEAVARSLRDVLAVRWLETRKRHYAVLSSYAKLRCVRRRLAIRRPSSHYLKAGACWPIYMVAEACRTWGAVARLSLYINVRRS